jgi:hypothetical protein
LAEAPERVKLIYRLDSIFVLLSVKRLNDTQGLTSTGLMFCFDFRTLTLPVTLISTVSSSYGRQELKSRRKFGALPPLTMVIVFKYVGILATSGTISCFVRPAGSTITELHFSDETLSNKGGATV